jgi:type I restriction enzyme S subunit
MANDLSEYRLSDIASFSYGKMPKKELLNTGDYPTFSGYKYQYTYPEYNCNEGDIIVVARGVGGTGDVKIVKEKCHLTNLSIKISLDTSKIENSYFYYLFLNKGLRHLDSGSAQSQITINDLSKEIIFLPSLHYQKSIIHILGSLDDKIELNRQMNETLEAMAQALFESWFVDFDPVIDNAIAAGNAIPDEFAERAEQRKAIEKKDHSDIQDLFPDEFEFTEDMGWIPRGWEVTTLESLAVISSSKRIFAKEYKTEGIPFFRGKEISLLSKGESFTQDIFISKERYQELKDKFGAPIAGDLLLTSVGTIGNVYLVQKGDEFYFKDGNLTWFSKYKTEIRGSYLSTWLSTRQAYLAIEDIKIGSTQQAITISSLNGIKIVKPKDEIIGLFNELSDSFSEKQTILIKDIRTLAKLRDTLLPKLMSGELRIPDAKVLVEEVL